MERHFKNCLRSNLYINDVEMDKVNVIQSDLFDNIKDNRYDYILNNPPFVPVPDGEFLPDCGAGGEDGLLLVRRILEKADQYLNPNGRLYMVLESIGNFEKPVVIEEFERYFRQGIVNVALLKYLNTMRTTREIISMPKITSQSFPVNALLFCIFVRV